MKDLEAQLDSADEPTKQILQHSTQMWLGGQELEREDDDVNGPIKSNLSNYTNKEDKT